MPDIITTLHPENNTDDNLYPNIKKENIPNKCIDNSKIEKETILLNNLNGEVIEYIDEQGKPTQEQVNNWLDDHPEATTTVQDGSITEIKLSDQLKIKTIKDYVIPEMFGAIGDGVTDDTNALEDAFNSGKSVYIPLKTYAVTRKIIIDRSVEIFGSGLGSSIIIINDINDYAIEVNDRKHTYMHDFRLYGNSKISNGLKIGLTYENTILENLYIDNMIGNLLFLGKTETENISENVVVKNCTFNATVNDVSWNYPIVIITNQNELKFYNNRIQFSSNNKQNNPCVSFRGVRTSHIDANIFYSSLDVGFELINSNDNACYSDMFTNNIIEKCGSSSGYAYRIIGASNNAITNIYFNDNYIYSSSERSGLIQYVNSAILKGNIYKVDILNSYNISRYDLSDTEIGYTVSSGNSEILVNGEEVSIYRKLGLLNNNKSARGFIQFNSNNQMNFNNNVSSMIFRDNNLLLDANNSALMLRDSNGKAWYIRVNTNGEIIVS